MIKTQVQLEDILVDIIDVINGHRPEDTMGRLNTAAEAMRPDVLAQREANTAALQLEAAKEADAAAQASAKVHAEWLKEQAAADAAIQQTKAAPPSTVPGGVVT